MNKQKNNFGETEISPKMIIWCVVLFLAFVLFLVIVFGSFYTIQAGQRGVLLTMGKPSMTSLGEGLGFKVPLFQSVKKMDVKTQKVESAADSASKDLQDVQTTIALNFHLNPEQVPKLYQEIGTDYKSRIIDPSIQESVKAVTARFTAEELITRRPEVRLGIQEALTEKLSKYYIKVDGLNIVNFQFSESFDEAIEQKVTAEQLKLKAQMDLERIRVEAEQKVTRAEAEAESIRIQSEALKQSSNVLELRWIEKWNGIMPTTYVSGDNDMLIGINQK